MDKQEWAKTKIKVMSKNEHMIFYRSKNPQRMSYVFFGNYKDKTGKMHTYTDVNGVAHRGFPNTQPVIRLDIMQPHHKLVDDFLQTHPLVLNGAWLRDDSIQRQEQEAAVIMTSANAVMEAAKLNAMEVREFSRLTGLNLDSRDDILKAHVLKMAAENPEYFMSIWFDEDKHYRGFILSAQEKGVIKWEKDVYKYGTQVIGVSDDQVIKWLKDNKDIFALLKNQIEGNGKVEMDLVEQKESAKKSKKK
tara:strand:+ start:128 stop:871 length:744 start_codon:yes stop_codon:yes gene_type:complete